MTRRIGTVTALLATVLIIGGCASSPTTEEASPADRLAAECATYKPLSDTKRAYDKVHADFDRAFPPYIFTDTFRINRGVYENGSDAERAYLMGEGPIPKSLDTPLNTVKPFIADEKRYVLAADEWDARLSAVGGPDQFSDMATPLWPNVTDPDLKGLLKTISDTDYGQDYEAVDRAFVAADSKCGF